MSFATQMESLAFSVVIPNRTEIATAAASTGVVDSITDLQNDLQGSYAIESHDAIKAFRSSIADALDPTTLQSLFDPILRQVGEDITSTPDPSASIAAILTDVYDYMDNPVNPATVVAGFDSTGASLGTPSAAAGNTGNGEVVRLTVDENGYTLDGWFDDDYTLTVDQDARTLGTTGQEVFRLEGEAAAIDGLQLTGTGIDQQIVSLDSRSSELLVKNPSFDDATSTAAVSTPAQPTALPGWTDETNGDWTSSYIDIDLAYINTPNAPANQSIRFKGNMTLSQDLVSVNGTSFNPDVPIVVGFAMYRESSATGTLTVSLGGVSRVITIGSESDDAWTWFWLVATPSESNWFKAFNQNTLKLSFVVASLAVGEILVDHIVTGEMTKVGAFGDQRTGRGSMGQWLAVRSGTTSWVKGDSFSWSDAPPTTRNTLGYWLKRSGRGYLPNAATATQVTAAGGRTLTFADDNPDTVTASSGSFISDGYKQGMTLTVAGTSSNNGTYTLATVTATGLTVIASDSLAAEGPLSATATLDAAASVADKT